MTISYSSRFQQPESVIAYDTGEYAANSYSSCIWQLQQPVLERILKDFRKSRSGPVRLLDFACGTGRVLANLVPLVDTAEGIDLSESMVDMARTRCPGTLLRVGDILTSPELLQDHYEIISSFRFFLNIEPEVRGRILSRLHEALCSPDGLLLVNIHGNSRSLRHPAILWRRWRERTQKTGALLNEMSPGEARKLLIGNGFKIVHQFGFGVLPPTLYRTPLRRVAKAVDRVLAGENAWSNWSIDMLFVCRPAENNEKLRGAV